MPDVAHGSKIKTIFGNGCAPAGFNNLTTSTAPLINIGQSLNSYMLGHFISE
jgi:hypothetical protein